MLINFRSWRLSAFCCSLSANSYATANLNTVSVPVIAATNSPGCGYEVLAIIQIWFDAKKITTAGDLKKWFKDVQRHSFCNLSNFQSAELF
jgi:hypothetical protein